CQEPSLSPFGRALSTALTGVIFAGSKANLDVSDGAAAGVFSGITLSLAKAAGASAILVSLTFSSVADGEISGAATIARLGGTTGLEGTGAATGSGAAGAGTADGRLAATGADDAASR